MCDGAASVATAHDESGRTVWICSGEERGHRPALGVAEQCCSRGSGGVHHGAHIVHAYLEARHVAVTVGQAGAALVKDDQAGKGGQARQQPGERRLFPERIDVRHPAGDDYQIARTASNDLVGNAYVAAFRVLGFGQHGDLPMVRKRGAGGPSPDSARVPRNEHAGSVAPRGRRRLTASREHGVRCRLPQSLITLISPRHGKWLRQPARMDNFELRRPALRGGPLMARKRKVKHARRTTRPGQSPTPRATL